MKNYGIILVGFILGLLISTGCGRKKQLEENTSVKEETKDIYVGSIPCADCQAIRMVVEFTSQDSFEMAMKYEGRNSDIYSYSGVYESLDDGRLKLYDGENVRWFDTTDEGLLMLDLEGNKIEGALADKYAFATAPQELQNSYWQLIELRGKAANELGKLDESPYFFVDDMGTVYGSTGCNSFRGVAKDIVKNKIVFSTMVSTRKACAEGMELETAFLKILGQSSEYRITNDELILFTGKMAPFAKFKRKYIL